MGMVMYMVIHMVMDMVMGMVMYMVMDTVMDVVMDIVVDINIPCYHKPSMVTECSLNIVQTIFGEKYIRQQFHTFLPDR